MARQRFQGIGAFLAGGIMCAVPHMALASDLAEPPMAAEPPSGPAPATSPSSTPTSPGAWVATPSSATAVPLVHAPPATTSSEQEWVVPPPVVTSPPPPACDSPDPRQDLLKRQRAERRRGRTMVGTGWAIFGSMYLSSALLGTAAIDLAGNDVRQRAWGQRMLLPVAGPFMAAFASQSATGALMTAMMGAAQVTGFALATVGHVRLHRLRREAVLTASVAGPTVGMQLKF